jgi:predicted phosphodiesterase
MNLLLVHGSPRKINEYLFEDREEQSLLRILENSDADILCFGHTHKPYHRILPAADSEGQSYRHALNPESSKLDKNAIDVEFVRFEYDVEKAAKAVEDSALPNEFADMLRRGF